MPPALSPPTATTNAAHWQAVCKACGRTFPVPEAATTELLDRGWPVCCGRDMTVLYFPDGVPPRRPPEKTGGSA